MSLRLHHQCRTSPKKNREQTGFLPLTVALMGDPSNELAEAFYQHEFNLYHDISNTIIIDKMLAMGRLDSIQICCKVFTLCFGTLLIPHTGCSAQCIKFLTAQPCRNGLRRVMKESNDSYSSQTISNTPKSNSVWTRPKRICAHMVRRRYTSVPKNYWPE